MHCETMRTTLQTAVTCVMFSGARGIQRSEKEVRRLGHDTRGRDVGLWRTRGKERVSEVEGRKGVDVWKLDDTSFSVSEKCREPVVSDNASESVLFSSSELSSLGRSSSISTSVSLPSSDPFPDQLQPVDPSGQSSVYPLLKVLAPSRSEVFKPTERVE